MSRKRPSAQQVAHMHRVLGGQSLYEREDRIVELGEKAEEMLDLNEPLVLSSPMRLYLGGAFIQWLTDPEGRPLDHFLAVNERGNQRTPRVVWADHLRRRQIRSSPDERASKPEAQTMPFPNRRKGTT